MNQRSVGTLTEARASEFLKRNGLRILARNYHCKSGEIDIIAADTDGTIVFVEVKYRRTDAYGLPEEAVSAGKQLVLQRAAMWYLKEQRLSLESAVRFDVIAMDSEEIRWYQNAF